jgi:hypothetical protein
MEKQMTYKQAEEYAKKHLKQKDRKIFSKKDHQLIKKQLLALLKTTNSY